MVLALYILFIIILLILSGLLSGAEVAVISLNLSRINKLKDEGNKQAARLHILAKNKERTVSSILLGNNLVNIIIPSLVTVFTVEMFGTMSVIFSTVLVTAFIIIFSEVLPKTYTIKNPEKVALFTAPLIWGSAKILYPLTLVIQKIVNLLLRLIGQHNTKEIVPLNEVIKNLIIFHQSKEKDENEYRDLEIINSLLGISEMPISKIMTHRSDVFSLDINLEKKALIEKALNCAHNKIPLWESSPDEITGILNVRDLLNLLISKKAEDIDLTPLIKSPSFVLDTTLVSAQLAIFQKNKESFAIVVNEYGVIEGIITLYDILEEIFGEMNHVRNNSTIVEIAPNTYSVSGKLSLRDLNRKIRYNLPTAHSTTVAGLILDTAERIPENGEAFNIKGINFKIVRKKNNAITRVIVTKSSKVKPLSFLKKEKVNEEI